MKPSAISVQVLAAVIGVGIIPRAQAPLLDPPACVDHRSELIARVSLAISRQEGWFVADTIARRQNNPGCLIFAHQHGARAGAGGYAVFPSPETGWRELEAHVERNGALPLGSFLEKHLGHPNARYVAAVERESGLDGRFVILRDGVSCQ